MCCRSLVYDSTITITTRRDPNPTPILFCVLDPAPEIDALVQSPSLYWQHQICCFLTPVGTLITRPGPFNRTYAADQFRYSKSSGSLGFGKTTGTTSVGTPPAAYQSFFPQCWLGIKDATTKIAVSSTFLASILYSELIVCAPFIPANRQPHRNPISSVCNELHNISIERLR